MDRLQQTLVVHDATSPDEKTPVEQGLELFVFAPVGLAVTAFTQLPEMVARGRAQVENQLTVARFLGQFAVQHGRKEVEKRIKAYIEPAVPPEPPPEPDLPAARPAKHVPVPAQPPAGMTSPATVLVEPAPEPPLPDSDLGLAPPGAGSLAIPGYDALSASQVVQRLAGLSSPELEQVRVYEAANRGRKTVLTKISQLP